MRSANLRGRVATLTLLTVSIVTACDEPVENKVDALIEQYERQQIMYCDCEEDRSSCEQDAAILPAQRRCVADAFARDEAASAQYLDCVLPLKEELTACIDSRLVCDDSYGEEQCYDDWEIGFLRCAALPSTVKRALDECEV
jgi:hypothetical protein